MNENIVFVFTNEDFKDVIKIKNLEKNILAICKNYQIKEKLSKQKIDCKVISDYSLSETKIIKPIEWIKSWPNEIL